MATPSGVQGQLLEITVVGCNKLRDTEWISRQDPYVVLEYANSKFRTVTHTDGGKNPNFNEKFSLSLIEGLREVSLTVWNSNTFTADDFIGNGTIKLNRVLSQGYDDTTWSILSKRRKYAGEVRIIMHYTNAKSSLAAQHPTVPPYSAPPPVPCQNPYAPPTSYPLPVYHSPCPPQPPMPAPYAPTTYSHSPSATAYPHPPPYPPPYPPQTYPPPSSHSPTPPSPYASLVPYGGMGPPRPPY